MSKKCEKEEKVEREKIKKALSKDNQDGMQNIRLSQLSRAGIYYARVNAATRTAEC